MSHAKVVARDAASLLTSRLSVAGIALLFLGVSTRLLTLEEMAVFAVYNTFCGALTVVCSLGLLASCIRRVPGLLAEGREAQAGGLIRLSVRVYVMGAAAVTLLLWAAAEPISRVLLKTPDRAADVRMAAGAALCFGLYEAGQLLLSALQRFGRVSANNVGAALVQRTLSLGLFFMVGLKGYLAGFAVGSLVGAIVAALAIRPYFRRGGETAAWREISWAGPYYADGYLRYLYMHADQLLVGIVLSPAALSIYFIAKRFLQYCQVLVSSLVDPLGTKVAELAAGEPASISRAFGASQRLVIFIFLPMSALLAASSPFLLALIGGNRYADAAAPLALLFLSVPFYAVFMHLSTFLYVLGAPRERLVNNLVSTAAQGLGILLLMPPLALGGLALARVTGFAAAALFARRRAARYLPEGTRGATAGAIAASAIPSALMAGLILGPHLLIGSPWWIPVWAAPVAALGLVAHLRYAVGPRDRDALLSALPGGRRLARLFGRETRPEPAADSPSSWH